MRLKAANGTLSFDVAPAAQFEGSLDHQNRTVRLIGSDSERICQTIRIQFQDIAALRDLPIALDILQKTRRALQESAGQSWCSCFDGIAVVKIGSREHPESICGSTNVGSRTLTYSAALWISAVTASAGAVSKIAKPSSIFRVRGGHAIGLVSQVIHPIAASTGSMTAHGSCSRSLRVT